MVTRPVEIKYAGENTVCYDVEDQSYGRIHGCDDAKDYVGEAVCGNSSRLKNASALKCDNFKTDRYFCSYVVNAHEAKCSPSLFESLKFGLFDQGWKTKLRQSLQWCDYEKRSLESSVQERLWGIVNGMLNSDQGDNSLRYFKYNTAIYTLIKDRDDVCSIDFKPILADYIIDYSLGLIIRKVFDNQKIERIRERIINRLRGLTNPNRVYDEVSTIYNELRKIPLKKNRKSVNINNKTDVSRET